MLYFSLQPNDRGAAVLELPGQVAVAGFDLHQLLVHEFHLHL